MAGAVTRDEFDELAGEVAGEKVVTRHILEQTRRNSDDLAALRTRTKRIEEKVDQLDRKVDDLDRKVDDLDRKVGSLNGKVDGFLRELPGMVRDTMREVLRERDGKK